MPRGKYMSKGEMKRVVEGYIVCYDLYASYDPEKGYSKLPSRARRLLRKIVEGEDVERLQDSVLLVKTTTALNFLLESLRPYAKSLLILRAEGVAYYYEPEEK